MVPEIEGERRTLRGPSKTKICSPSKNSIDPAVVGWVIIKVGAGAGVKTEEESIFIAPFCAEARTEVALGLDETTLEIFKSTVLFGALEELLSFMAAICPDAIAF